MCVGRRGPQHYDCSSGALEDLIVLCIVEHIVRFSRLETGAVADVWLAGMLKGRSLL